jgi:hypothetical protein
VCAGIVYGSSTNFALAQVSFTILNVFESYYIIMQILREISLHKLFCCTTFADVTELISHVCEL